MEPLIDILISVIILIHVYIMFFEMFAWEKKGPKIFKSLPKELFPQTKTLAGNQGLYNGFLAAGLVWSLLIADPLWSMHVATFFVACIFIAGVYGAITTERKILFVQSVPTLLVLVLMYLI